MEQYDILDNKLKHIKKKILAEMITYKYIIEYTDSDGEIYKLISKNVYKKLNLAKVAADEKINKIKKITEDYTNFVYKIQKMSIPKKEFNKIVSLATLKKDEVYEERWNIIRKGKKYSIDEVLSKYDKKDKLVNFDGDLIAMGSQRYENFKYHGVVCECCNIEGKYFRKERFSHNNCYHFNLYALDNKGKEVLMTKDHFKARSKGGADSIDNYQPLCEKCNHLKGSMDNEEFMKANKKNSISI